MMTTLRKFYSRLVSVLTAFVMACTTAAFTVTTASGADISEQELAEMANEIAMMVNEARREEGLNELYVVPYLNECARIRGYEASNVWSHTRPNGEYFVTVIDQSIIEYSKIGENLAAGSNTAAGAFDQWKNSPKHWANVIDPKYTHMGLAAVYAPESPYGYYWVQIFTRDLWDENAEYEGQYLPSAHVIVPIDEGDVNGDETIDIYDYIVLVDYLNKKKQGVPAYFNDAQLEAADCFKDGLITEVDAKCMMRYILGEYKSLPFEF